MNSDVGRLAHKIAAVKPSKQFAVLGNHKNRRGDAVDGDDLAVRRHGEPGDDVDVAYRNLLDEVAVLREDLHAGPLVAAVAHDVLAAHAHHGHLPRVPKLTLVLPGNTELKFICTSLFKYLKSIRL